MGPTGIHINHAASSLTLLLRAQIRLDLGVAEFTPLELFPVSTTFDASLETIRARRFFFAAFQSLHLTGVTAWQSLSSVSSSAPAPCSGWWICAEGTPCKKEQTDEKTDKMKVCGWVGGGVKMGGAGKKLER
jgi:hypothetical protein